MQELAVACLGQYAEASVVNCGKIAVVGGGRALGRIARAAAAEGRRSGLPTQPFWPWQNDLPSGRTSGKTKRAAVGLS